jgi:hypothetical protein
MCSSCIPFFLPCLNHELFILASIFSIISSVEKRDLCVVRVESAVDLILLSSHETTTREFKVLDKHIYNLK